MWRAVLKKHFDTFFYICVLSELSIRRRRFSGILPDLFFLLYREQQAPKKASLGAKLALLAGVRTAVKIACYYTYRIHHSAPFH